MHKNQNKMEYSQQNDIVCFSTRDELIRVHLDEVIYFESNGNYIKMVCAGDFVTNLLTSMASLTDIFNAVKGVRFVRVGKSHYVNMKRLCQINTLRKQLLLYNTQSLPLVYLTASKESLRELKQHMSEESLVSIPNFKTHNGKMLALREEDST